MLGPYREKKRWRLVIIDDSGRRSFYFDNEKSAQRKKAKVALTLEPSPNRKMIAHMLDEYLQFKIDTARTLPRTAWAERRRLVSFLGLYVEREIGAVTPQRAALLYQHAANKTSSKTGKPLSAATHRCYLVYAKTFFGWAVERRYIGENPFKSLRPVGRPTRGKTQLRIDEARRFIEAGQQLFAEREDALAVAALVALMMGMRASEILKRRVRDVDAGGSVLWIDSGKTRNARRHLKVPKALQPMLRQLCSGKPADALVFGLSLTGKPRSYQTLWWKVRQICQAADVPIVCTHSLRGLYATLAVESGALSEAVASSLGHGSFAITERHYAEPGAVHNAKTERVSSLLEVGEADEDDALTVLRGLDRDTLARLLRLAKEGGVPGRN